jgi:hypothetical protein
MLLLRQRLPILRDTPIPELKAGLVGDGIEIGEMWDDEADELAHHMEAFGIKVITEPSEAGTART